MYCITKCTTLFIINFIINRLYYQNMKNDNLGSSTIFLNSLHNMGLKPMTIMKHQVNIRVPADVCKSHPAINSRIIVGSIFHKCWLLVTF